MSYTSENEVSCFTEFYRTCERVAKKEHICCECGKTIQKGERYQYVYGVWEIDGCKDSGGSKTCLDCVRTWDFVTDAFYENHNGPSSVIHGMLGEAIDEGVESEFISEKDPLIKKWLKRAKR